jgi:hypothetical protein
MVRRAPDAVDDAYARLVNADPEFALAARTMSVDLLLGGSSRANVLHFVDGRLASFRAAAFDAPWQVGLRASDATWSRFLADPPPPTYTDLWAMRARVEDFRIEGDTLLLARWARALTRATNLLRVWAHGT